MGLRRKKNFFLLMYQYPSLIIRIRRFLPHFLLSNINIAAMQDLFLCSGQFPLEVVAVQQVVCWLIRCKTQICLTGQTSKANIKKYFFRRFPLSRFLAKTLDWLIRRKARVRSSDQSPKGNIKKQISGKNSENK